MMSADLGLEQRLRRLEDIQALTVLKHRYCEYCDDSYNAEKIATLFTEDATWNGGALGRARTRAKIAIYFAASSQLVPFAIHHVTNPLIEVDGDRAACRWYLWQPMVMRDVEDALWYAARYDDVCVRQDGVWLFQSVEITTRMLSPYAAGFRQTPILDLAQADLRRDGHAPRAE